ncbi:WxL domain-containing protein [Vagococcus sp. JNUCC 83]
MKKKTILGTSFLLISTIVIGGVASQAEKVGNTESKAAVKFKVSETPLSFAGNKATNIQFGEVAIEGNDKTYKAIYSGDTFTPDGASAPQFAAPSVTVKDDRGTMPGYSVSVKMTQQFTSSVKNTDTLKGAKLDLTATNAATDQTTSYRKAPTTFNTNVVVGEGVEAQPIFGANAGEGAGSWTVFFGNNVDSATQPDASVENDKVKLHLPGGNKIDTTATYTATLEWALEDTPL